MSISSEITRLSNAKTAIASAITTKGVSVPTGTMLEGMPALILQIQGGQPAPVVTYSVTPETETWEHNQWVTLSLEIDSSGNLSVTKSSGGGTVDNPRICYPQSDTYDASTVITQIPSIPQAAGDYELDISVWWDSGSSIASDHSNHTITYTVVAESSTTKRIYANGTYDVTNYTSAVVAIPSYDGSVE